MSPRAATCFRRAMHVVSSKRKELIHYGTLQAIGPGGSSDLPIPRVRVSRSGLELQSFNEEYVRALIEGQPGIERHFTAYFSKLIAVKLRARRLPAHAIDDIQQETFLRVFVTLRRDGGLQSASRLGAFVNAICNNVYMEYLRSRSIGTADASTDEPRDSRKGVEETLISEEHRQVVHEVLAEMPRKDEQVLRSVLLDEREKSEVCRELKISRENLRVILYRARTRFREILRHKYPDVGRRAAPGGGTTPAFRQKEGGAA